jgi:hypothetical protein
VERVALTIPPLMGQARTLAVGWARSAIPMFGSLASTPDVEHPRTPTPDSFDGAASARIDTRWRRPSSDRKRTMIKTVERAGSVTYTLISRQRWRLSVLICS